MPDTYTLHFQNFRSLRDVKVDIAPLTVVYGPNGSGKSSLIYALLALKNFLTNPDQNIPSLFSYPSISLGGLTEVAHRHTNEREISLSIGVSGSSSLSPKFTLKLARSGGEARMAFDRSQVGAFPAWPENMNLDISIPYRVNQLDDCPIAVNVAAPNQPPVEAEGLLVWNGVALSLRLDPEWADLVNVVKTLNERANLPLELARRTGFVPLRRGFSKPTYGMSSVTPGLSSEDEVASLLASHDERFRQYEVSRYVEKIVNRRIQTQSHIGTSAFTIDSIPTTTGVPVFYRQRRLRDQPIGVHVDHLPLLPVQDRGDRGA